MPNICTTNYVIEGKKEELDALYQKMKELQEMEQPLVENNLGPTWLGCLVKALGCFLQEKQGDDTAAGH